MFPAGTPDVRRSPDGLSVAPTSRPCFHGAELLAARHLSRGGRCHTFWRLGGAPSVSVLRLSPRPKASIARLQRGFVPLGNISHCYRVAQFVITAPGDKGPHCASDAGPEAGGGTLVGEVGSGAKRRATEFEAGAPSRANLCRTPCLRTQPLATIARVSWILSIPGVTAPLFTHAVASNLTLIRRPIYPSRRR